MTIGENAYYLVHPEIAIVKIVELEKENAELKEQLKAANEYREKHLKKANEYYRKHKKEVLRKAKNRYRIKCGLKPL